MHTTTRSRPTTMIGTILLVLGMVFTMLALAAAPASADSTCEDLDVGQRVVKRVILDLSITGDASDAVDFTLDTDDANVSCGTDGGQSLTLTVDGFTVTTANSTDSPTALHVSCSENPVDAGWELTWGDPSTTYEVVGFQLDVQTKNANNLYINICEEIEDETSPTAPEFTVSSVCDPATNAPVVVVDVTSNPDNEPIGIEIGDESQGSITDDETFEGTAGSVLTATYDTDEQSAEFLGDCEAPSTPEPTFVESEWIDGEFDCDDTTVEQTREVTTTTYKVVGEPGAWMIEAQEPVTETETRSRDLTAEDKADCPAAVLPNVLEREPTPAAAPAAQEKADPAPVVASEQLPNAGFDGNTLLLLVAGALLALGSGLLRYDRRRYGHVS